MTERTRMGNARNRWQGVDKRVLCVCSAGLLRSPTAAWVLGNAPYNYNTRACGADADYALVVLDDVLLHWADEIVCMDDEQYDTVLEKLKDHVLNKRVINLRVKDSFAYKDPELVELVTNRYNESLPNGEEDEPTEEAPNV